MFGTVYLNHRGKKQYLCDVSTENLESLLKKAKDVDASEGRDFDEYVLYASQLSRYIEALEEELKSREG